MHTQNRVGVWDGYLVRLMIINDDRRGAVFLWRDGGR